MVVPTRQPAAARRQAFPPDTPQVAGRDHGPIGHLCSPSQMFAGNDSSWHAYGALRRFASIVDRTCSPFVFPSRYALVSVAHLEHADTTLANQQKIPAFTGVRFGFRDLCSEKDDSAPGWVAGKPETEVTSPSSALPLCCAPPHGSCMNSPVTLSMQAIGVSFGGTWAYGTNCNQCTT